MPKRAILDVDGTPVWDFWGAAYLDELLVKSGRSECIEYDGYCHPIYGYGQLPESQRVYGTTRAHRIAWTKANGPIPEGLNVLHHCDNPPCVRPSHLFLGTQQDNMDDMNAKDRHYRGEHGAEARYQEGCRCEPCVEHGRGRQQRKSEQRRAKREAQVG